MAVLACKLKSLMPSSTACLDDNDANTKSKIDNNRPILHLAFVSADPTSNRASILGDGGASLNAYAACRTLKVMF
jgi:hypothetical protein